MAGIPYGTAEAFGMGRPAQSGAFVSVGDALYSYALKIAHYDGDALVWDICPHNPPKHSVTTSRHIRAAVDTLPKREHTCSECEARA